MSTALDSPMGAQATVARVTGARILFVEDEPSIFEPFSKALAREGFEPVVATTVAKAIEIAERVDPDLVLLDLNLPDGDGRDVARALRRKGDTPIIMVTARGTETDRIVGLELGADDYVVKPFSGAEVIARMRAILRRTGRAGAASSDAPPPAPAGPGRGGGRAPPPPPCRSPSATCRSTSPRAARASAARSSRWPARSS